MEEIWKPVVNHEGFYEVSNLGRVRSLDRMTVSRPVYGKILSTKQADLKKYEKVALYDNGKVKYYKVHQLVARAFIPLPDFDNTYEVNHKDGNRHNNKEENLEWLTHEENIAYKKELGTLLTGSNHQNSKLNENQVRDIKISLKNGAKGSVLAREYNVCQDVISRIKLGKSWKHVNI